MSAPALADNCGNCLTPDRSAAVLPHRTRDRGDYIHAAYRCPECRHRWSTDWLVSALAPATPEHPRRSA